VTTATAAGGVLSRFDTQLNGRDPVWRAEARLAALEWVGKHGFPTRKDEDWKYTGLDSILAVPFEAATVGSSRWVTADMIEAVAVDLGGARLVFVNGHFASELSRLAGLPAGAEVTSLAAVMAAGPERLERFFSHASGEHHAFAAFNDALTEDGAFVHLTPGTCVNEPIQLVFLSDTGGFPLMSSPRSVIVAEPGSSATIVETYAGFDGDVYCTNAVTEVVLAEDAQIEHYKVQDEPVTAFHLALLDVRQGRNSGFSSCSVMLGSRIARHEVRVLLEDVGAEVSLDGVYLPQGDQLHDNNDLRRSRRGQLHQSPALQGCAGRSRARGVQRAHHGSSGRGRNRCEPEEQELDSLRPR
jgi:Fe-S cluster assembly protein SufD